MSLLFNPEIRKCFVPCSDSLAGKWCKCQHPYEVTVERTPKERFQHIAEAFKQQMIKENTDNAHKGDILDWDNVDEMLSELEWHKAKLLIAMRDKNPDTVKEHLADCANYLLAIGNAWKLYE